jgi:hypothetical protein
MMRRDESRGDTLILDVLARCTGKPLTLEDLAAMVPELSWAELFQAVDRLSRRRRIALSRQGFTYLLVYLTSPDQQAELVMTGSEPDYR